MTLVGCPWTPLPEARGTPTRSLKKNNNNNNNHKKSNLPGRSVLQHAPRSISPKGFLAAFSKRARFAVQRGAAN